MKNLFKILLLSLLVFSCTEKEVPMEMLVIRNGIYYSSTDSNIPYTGKVTSSYIKKGYIKNGKKSGYWIETFEYPGGEFVESGLFGTYRSSVEGLVKGEYKEGKEHDKWTWFFQNGQLKQEGSYINGLQDGKWFYYDEGDIYEGGTLQKEETYKYGKLIETKEY